MPTTRQTKQLEIPTGHPQIGNMVICSEGCLVSDIFLIANQHGYFLAKSGDFIHPRETKNLYKTPFKDEAINKKVDFAVKSAELRLHIVTAPHDDKGLPQLPDDYLSVPDVVREAPTSPISTTPAFDQATAQQSHNEILNMVTSVEKPRPDQDELFKE